MEPRIELALAFRSVMSELKVESRSFFELKLAGKINSNSRNISGVHQVSQKFLEILESNKKVVLDLLNQEDGKIFKILKHELFSDLKFGRILEKEINPEILKTSEDLLDLFLNILSQSPEIQLDQLMQVHSVVGYQILSKLSPEHIFNFRATREELSKEFKSETARGRKAESLGPDGKIIRKMGIKRSDLGFNSAIFFKNMSRKLPGQVDYGFEHGMDTLSKDPESPYVKSLEDFSLPFVCGPSNHTAALLAGAVRFAELSSPEAIQEYALGIFSFLARGGHHSFHEVFLIAEKAGVPYVSGKYQPSIPESVFSLSGMRELFEEEGLGLKL